MRLYSETTGGQGPDLVLLHGWGMHGGIWQHWLPKLKPRFRVTLIDLPGHGYSDALHGDTLETMAQAVAAQLPEQSLLCGWSLGGLIAQYIVSRGLAPIRKLILIASTPCFVKRPDWPYAMAPGVLEGFAENLQSSPGATLKRFLGLQLRGCDNERGLLRDMLAALDTRPAARPETLYAGLGMLRDHDLRPDLNRMKTPALWIFGEHDRLVPATVAHALGNTDSRQTCCLQGAGHAPFLSQPGSTADLIGNFCHD